MLDTNFGKVEVTYRKGRVCIQSKDCMTILGRSCKFSAYFELENSIPIAEPVEFEVFKPCGGMIYNKEFNQFVLNFVKGLLSKIDNQFTANEIAQLIIDNRSEIKNCQASITSYTQYLKGKEANLRVVESKLKQVKDVEKIDKEILDTEFGELEFWIDDGKIGFGTLPGGCFDIDDGKGMVCYEFSISFSKDTSPELYFEYDDIEVSKEVEERIIFACTDVLKSLEAKYPTLWDSLEYQEFIRLKDAYTKDIEDYTSTIAKYNEKIRNSEINIDSLFQRAESLNIRKEVDKLLENIGG